MRESALRRIRAGGEYTSVWEGSSFHEGYVVKAPFIDDMSVVFVVIREEPEFGTDILPLPRLYPLKVRWVLDLVQHFGGVITLEIYRVANHVYGTMTKLGRP